MKTKSVALALAFGLLVIGCGGGGGGKTSTDSSINTPVVSGNATFPGTRGNYSIARASGGAYTVTDRRSGSATNVSGAQTIGFSDMTVNLGIGDKAVIFGSYRTKELIELYVAFLNRVPNADSLATWIDRANAGQTMAQIADGLYAEAIQIPERTGYSATMLNFEFVTAAYKNVFGLFGDSAPPLADVETWASRIDKGGISRSALVVAMLAEARSGTSGLSAPAVTQLLDNRAAIGDYFAVQHGLNYNASQDPLARTGEILTAVTAADMTKAQAMIGFSDAGFNLRGGGGGK